MTPRIALAAASLAATLTGMTPAHALLGQTITCSGAMSQYSGGPYGASVQGVGYLTCTLTPTTAPNATSVGTVYVTTWAANCTLISQFRDYDFSIGGHSYSVGYNGEAGEGLAGNAEAGVLVDASKDGWWYILGATKPLAGTSVVVDPSAGVVPCTGAAYPGHSVLVQFSAVLPELL